mgnify:CR=1 FL=1
MRFIHVSDVHLGMIPDKGKPWSDVRAKEIEETFDRILDIAEERKVDLLLIAGNLYHSAPKAADLAKLDARLAKLTNTRTVIIAGSSDYIESGSPSENYEFTSNTVLLPAGEFSNAYFEDINTCVTGFSYGQAEYTMPRRKALSIYFSCMEEMPATVHLISESWLTQDLTMWHSDT